MPDLVIRTKADVIQYINHRPISKSAGWIVLIALGGVFVDGYDLSSIGIGVPGLAAEFHLSSFDIGSVVAIMGFGAVLGGILGGYYTDTIGRFRMFLLDLLCLVFAAIGTALAPNVYCLILFRFLMGVGIGLDYPVAFSFIVEYVNLRRKGGGVALWVLMYQLALACSVLVALLFYHLGAGIYLWRYVVGLGALPALAVLILRSKYMWESPMWAAHNLGLGEAAKILAKTYHIQVSVSEPLNLKHDTERLSANSFREIFSSKYLPRTVLSSIIAVTMSAQYIAIGFYMPIITQQIFGKEFVYAAVGTLASTLVGATAGLCSALFVNRLGVLRLTVAGYLLIIASLLAFWWTAGRVSPYISIVIVYAFIFGQAGGPGPQSATISALSYPTTIRGMGTGWSQGMARLGTMIGAYFSPILLGLVGISHMMLILSAVPLAALLAIWLIRWEPIGRDIETEDQTLPASFTGVEFAMPGGKIGLDS
jgi:MFS transporter, putative metabolite transport protein